MPSSRRELLTGVASASGLVLAAGTLAQARSRTPSAAPSVIEVRAAPNSISGTLRFAGNSYPCMVGKSGIRHPKYEGDGGTPAGLFPLRSVRYRADRMSAPKTGLPVYKAAQNDGWCDDPSDLAYNHVVTMPYQTDAEPMWRDDHLYDVLAVIGYNDNPVVPGAGSAIFLHVMRPPTDDHQYTAGCVSLAIENLLAVLAACVPGTMIDIRQA